ncbi:MAG TPA: ferric reductase-like transmembrane domain-containing protein, partial [Candidatus Thermoplasmatota archaeon]|nr:ferric reductase-like transmembrane domain-containing protein [Candidatus Thermoplasmatota archaeon]
PSLVFGGTFGKSSVVTMNKWFGGPGTWKLTVAYRGWDAQGSYDLFTGVYYNVTGLVIMPGPALLAPNEQHTFTFKLKVKDVEGLQRMRYGGVAVAYHEHTDKNIDNDGNYDKWNTMQFETGAQLRLSGEAFTVGPAVDTLGPVFRRWGQVLGFAGAFLIIPSLVFGGTFGKSSVVTMNKWFGGPRRRVLFHNSMSFWLLGVALLHTLLFLYEAFWNWSHGLLWGGLALACMIGLGVTGATQRSFVARWGFNRWRFVHFAMGVLVVVFVLVHMLADGSHLAPIRSAFFGGSATDASGANL